MGAVSATVPVADSVLSCEVLVEEPLFGCSVFCKSSQSAWTSASHSPSSRSLSTTFLISTPPRSFVQADKAFCKTSLSGCFLSFSRNLWIRASMTEFRNQISAKLRGHWKLTGLYADGDERGGGKYQAMLGERANEIITLQRTGRRQSRRHFRDWRMTPRVNTRRA